MINTIITKYNFSVGKLIAISNFVMGFVVLVFVTNPEGILGLPIWVYNFLLGTVCWFIAKEPLIAKKRFEATSNKSEREV